MYTAEQLEQMRNVDIVAVDRELLVDLSAVPIDQSTPFDERIQRFFDQVKNPYVFRVGDSPVKLVFSGDGPYLHDLLQTYLLSLRAGC